jgi:hypothetical protein
MGFGSRAAVVLAAFSAVLLGSSPSFAVTPESKEVKAMIDRGLTFLEKNPSGQLGERVLAAIPFVKADKKDHPFVQAVHAEVRRTEWKGVFDIYAVSVAVIFLTEINDEADKALIKTIMEDLVSRQKPHGGWGYVGMQTGDVSQTQYVVLAIWGAKQCGVETPQESIDKVCNWFIRVQDPEGGWGYQGIDPGNYQRVKQDPVSLSLSAAGLGSLCVCADLLGVRRPGGKEEEDPEETGLPSALKTVKKPKSAEPPPPEVDTTVDRALLEKAIDDGTTWFARNYSIVAARWNFYYLYGLERCESFRELYLRKEKKEAPWYNDGVAFLTKTRQANSYWHAEHSAVATTAFALLFLQRSSQKAIAKVHKDLGEGVLTSGKGLPTDLANVSVKRGKIVDSTLSGEVDDVLALLDDPENPELSRVLENNEKISLDPDLTKRTDQITRLRSLVSAESWEARMVAVRALGKSRDFDVVPSLLYALTDPDKRVVKEADAALRFISRKFNGVGLPEDPDKRAIQAARDEWRKWYLSVRPDATLID